MDTAVSVNQPLPAGATGVGGKYSSLYLNVPGPRGLESGQLWTGNGNGLVIRTNPNTGAAFPIRLAPNNTDALVLNPDRSATFYGNLSVLGTASLSNLSLLNASIDTNQAARFRSGVTVDGNILIGTIGATGASNTVSINGAALSVNAVSNFNNSVVFTNITSNTGNPYARVQYVQTWVLPSTWTLLELGAITHTRGIQVATGTNWVRPDQRAIEISRTGVYSINVTLHRYAEVADATVHTVTIQLFRFQTPPAPIGWSISGVEVIAVRYHTHHPTQEWMTHEMSREVFLNRGDFIVTGIYSNHPSAMEAYIHGTSHISIRYVG